MTRDEFNDKWASREKMGPRGDVWAAIGKDVSAATLDGWFRPEVLREIADDIEKVGAALKPSTQKGK